VTAEGRASAASEYNDAQSLRAAVEAAGKDLAAILVTAFRHDMRPRSRTADGGIRGSRAAACDAADASLDYR
jgi:glutamate-1-semialdehyde 2,1-aminomutase